MQNVRVVVFGLLVSVLFIAGCANPFVAGTSSVADTYLTEFRDVPIPVVMSIDLGAKEASQTDSGRAGYMRFKGNVEWASLIEACIYNMHQQNWTPLAIYKSENGVLAFQKDERLCIIVITDAFPSTIMQVWISPRMNDFVVPPTAPVGSAPVKPDGVYNEADNNQTYDEYQPAASGSGSNAPQDYSNNAGGTTSNEQILTE